MDAAPVVHLTGDHARAVRRDDLARLRDREIGATLRHQTGGAEAPATVTTVAGDLVRGCFFISGFG
jgi:hypothetical protein